MTRRLAADPGVLFALGFRPFFLAAGLAGVGLTLEWLVILHGGLAAPAWLDPFLWHGHEMLFGLVHAAIAGFLLTSVPVWTGTPPVRGARLAGLVGLWLLGRGAMALAGALPAAAVAALDLAFPVALWMAVGTPILRARATRQLGILGALLGLIAANAASHLDAMGVVPGAGRAALHAASVFVALLILVIGGRITPAFTRNAMQRAGVPPAVQMRPWLDRLALGAAVALAVVEVSTAPRGLASGLLAGLAALGTAGRMVGWQTRWALRDPLLASLHAGLAWVAVGFGAIAAADLGAPLPRTVALHALTAGAMGTMILAVMTRVPLGHTGRPLVAPRAATAAYVLVGAGALVRIVGPTLEPTAALTAWTLSGLLWAGAFASFLVGYAGILVRPRVDGKPG
jgi:uncharacterized protein involved in response to NO